MQKCRGQSWVDRYATDLTWIWTVGSESDGVDERGHMAAARWAAHGGGAEGTRRSSTIPGVPVGNPRLGLDREHKGMIANKIKLSWSSREGWWRLSTVNGGVGSPARSGKTLGSVFQRKREREGLRVVTCCFSGVETVLWWRLGSGTSRAAAMADGGAAAAVWRGVKAALVLRLVLRGEVGC